MTFHEMTVQISKGEGGKVNLTIAQIKEVMRNYFLVLAKMPYTEADKFHLKYRDYYLSRMVKKNGKAKK